MNPTSEAEYWVICPVCLDPNPAGNTYCRYCWSPALGSGKIISAKELTEALKQYRDYELKKKIVSWIKKGLIFTFILAAMSLLILYNCTDLFPPKETVNSNSAPEEWAMFRHDLLHSGSGNISDVPIRGIKKWAFTTGGAIYSSPAIAGGTVYFGSRDSKLYALDADTGAKRWEYQTGSWVESSPAIAGGIVYFGSNDGTFYALNAETGKKLWEFDTVYPITSSPAVADGVVYFGADDYYVYAVDALKGKKIWKFLTLSPVKSSPAISKGIIYIGSGNEFAYAINANNGKMRLKFKSYSPFISSPLVIDNTVIFTSFYKYLYAVDGNARNGFREHEIRPIWLQLWAFGVPIPQPPLQSGSKWGINLGGQMTSSPVLNGENLYVGSDNDLFAIDIKTHQKLWSFHTLGHVESSPAVCGGTVYIGSKDCRLYAIDTATGKKLWDYLTGGEITSSPAVMNGIVYIGSYDGKLYAIR